MSCGHEILSTCTLVTEEQEFEAPYSISIPNNGFLGPQNSALTLGY
jgi:hypothetical protein